MRGYEVDGCESLWLALSMCSLLIAAGWSWSLPIHQAQSIIFGEEN